MLKSILKERVTLGGIVSVLMFIALFPSWIDVTSRNAFELANDAVPMRSFIMWVIIILTIAGVAISVLVADKQKKSRLLGILSVLILVVMIIAYFIVIREYAIQTKIGWKLMLLFNVIQIALSVKDNFDAVKKIASDVTKDM